MNPSTQPVCKALHKPLTLLWIDRRLFMLCVAVGFVALQVSADITAALISFAVAYWVSYALTAHDPSFARVRLLSLWQKRYYDPIRHDPFQVEVIRKDV